MPRHLLVLGDSLAFHGPVRPEALTHPGLYPNVCAGELGTGVEVDLLARQGWTARDAWWAMTKDPHSWGLWVPRAEGAVLGVGQMDQLPASVPTWARESIPYLRPGSLRRRARAAYRSWSPAVIRATGGRMRQLPQAATDRYLSRIVEALRHHHPRLPVVLLGPGPWNPVVYPATRTHEPAVVAARAWAQRHGVGLVDLDPIVAPSLRDGTGNPDGMHFAWSVHRAIGVAAAAALREQGWGDRPAPDAGRSRLVAAAEGARRRVGAAGGNPVTTLTLAFAALAMLAAVVDWWAVGYDRRRVEYVAKPLALVLVIGVAATIDAYDPRVRVLVIAGLVFSLLGDVLLMLDRFVPGVVAFALTQVCYLAAFVPLPHEWLRLVLAVVGVGAVIATVGVRVVRGAASGRIRGWGRRCSGTCCW